MGCCGKYTLVLVVVQKKIILRHGSWTEYIGFVSVYAVVQAMEINEILRKSMKTENERK